MTSHDAWSRSVLRAIHDDDDEAVESLFSHALDQRGAAAASEWFEQRVEAGGVFGGAAPLAGLAHEAGDTALHLAAKNGK